MKKFNLKILVKSFNVKYTTKLNNYINNYVTKIII